MTRPGANETVALPSPATALPPLSGVTRPGGERPLPGVAAGSVGSESAPCGVVSSVPFVAIELPSDPFAPVVVGASPTAPEPLDAVAVDGASPVTDVDGAESGGTTVGWSRRRDLRRVDGRCARRAVEPGRRRDRDVTSERRSVDRRRRRDPRADVDRVRIGPGSHRTDRRSFDLRRVGRRDRVVVSRRRRSAGRDERRHDLVVDPPQVEAPPVGPITSGTRIRTRSTSGPGFRRLRRSTLRRSEVTSRSRRRRARRRDRRTDRRPAAGDDAGPADGRSAGLRSVDVRHRVTRRRPRLRRAAPAQPATHRRRRARPDPTAAPTRRTDRTRRHRKESTRCRRIPPRLPAAAASPPGLVTPDNGGSAVAGDGSATVLFAPGLVTGSTVVSVSTTDASTFGIRPASAVYDLTAVDTRPATTISHFSGSPVLTISYDPSKPTPTAIYYLDPVNGPVALPSTVDTVHHTITAALPHFSTYFAGLRDLAPRAGAADRADLAARRRSPRPSPRAASARTAPPSTSPSAAARRSAAECPRAHRERRHLHRDDQRHRHRGGHGGGQRRALEPARDRVRDRPVHSVQHERRSGRASSR